MTNKKWVYWFLQIVGWGAVLSLGLLSEYLQNNKIEIITALKASILLIIVVSITHLYRFFLIHKKWLNRSISKVIPLVILGSLFVASILTVFKVVLTYAFSSERLFNENFFAAIIGGVVSYFILVLIWSIIYFGYHYFDKSRVQELKNLQLQTSQKESELINLKNQLNPHFMFNAMNSIRALVDDEPVLAKQSITQLSNLLRSTLQLGNKELIPLAEEIAIVKDYLALEKIRFEERLNIEISINEKHYQILVPPLIIQTLAENAIKHGISKKALGGTVSIYVSKLEDKLSVEVHNDGQYVEENKPETGIGLANSKKRLQILYGENAHLTIENYNKKVVTKLNIPYQN
jgi:two-component system, LytTR family, sensor kinase